MKFKNLFLLISIIVNTIYVSAQQINIAANIVDQNNKPLEYANAQLLNKDSVFIRGTASDQNGKIKLQANNKQSYWLVISAMGFTTSSIFLKDVASNVELGDIVMQEATTMLDSITVTAQRTTHKIDRQIAFPNTLQQKSSNNALELLYNMSFPGLIVNTMNKSISLIGNGSVQLRINGINASINEIAAIPTKDIIRIEFYDNPGIRIKENAMIDFIVKRRKSGGYLSTNLTNSPHVGFGNDMLTTKFNYKNSEWSAIYNLSYRSYKKRESETTTNFNFPDKSIIQQISGIPSPFNYQEHNLNLTYNYTIANKRVFNITITNYFLNSRGHDQHLNKYSDQSNLIYPSKTETKNQEKNPVLDIYYKEDLSKAQSLLFNVVAGYIGTAYSRNYQERNDFDNSLSEYDSDINGDKYSIIGEGNHLINWDNLTLFSGINYKLGYTKNQYNGTIIEETSLNNSDLYVYTQLRGKFKNLTYGLGIGVSYSYFNDMYKGFRFWTFRPYLSLAYSITKNLYLQYTFKVDPSIPSLSELSDVSQIVDQYRINKGNPNLKPYRIYTNIMNISYQRNSVQCNLGIAHQYFSNAIMPDTYLDKPTSKFIFTSNNQKYYQNTQLSVSANWQIIEELLSFNINGQINWMKSKGNEYNLKYTSYYYGGQMNFSLNKWRINIGANSRYKNLWGETIFYGDLWSTAEIGYKNKEFYVGLAAYNFLTDTWSSGSKNLSKIVSSTSWTYIDDSAPIFLLRLSWNFNWGKQSKSGEKMLNNKDTDSGILKAQ